MRPVSWASVRSWASRTQRRTSSATWSLRLRAVCSRPAGSPTISLRRLSTFMWMSSRAVENAKVPASISAETCRRPWWIASRSASRDDALPGQHGAVGDRALDILLRQAPVEADRGVDGLHEGARARTRTGRPTWCCRLFCVFVGHGLRFPCSMVSSTMPLPQASRRGRSKRAWPSTRQETRQAGIRFARVGAHTRRQRGDRGTT